MFNFIEKLEKEEKEYLKKDLQENVEVLSSTLKDLFSMVRSKEDKKVILDALAEICTTYDFGKIEQYNFKSLKSIILEKTNFIQDHIEGKVQSRLTDIKQQNHDNRNIRDLLDRSEKEKAVLKEENEELKQAKKFEERPEDGAEAKEENPFKKFRLDPAVLDDKIPQEIKDIGDFIFKDIIKNIKYHNDKYAKGGPTGLDPLCRANPYKIKMMKGGQGGGKNFFKNIFSKK